MSRVFWLLLLLSSVARVSGQFSGKNQLEFTDWQDYHRQILENWTDVTYQRDLLQFGLRYEINHPPDPFIFPQDSLLPEYQLTFGYTEINYRQLTARVGDFYTMFGRGLVLRTYEDRNLRVDNNIEGIKLDFAGHAFQLQTIAGKIRDKYNRRKDTVYGVDGEVRLRDNLQMGGSYLIQNEPGNQSSQIWATRIKLIQKWGDFYTEAARPEWANKFSYYLAFSTAFSKFGLTAEYKDYQHLSFRNYHGSEYNAAPALTREHAYSLLNRHPHALNMNDEKGYQIELNYVPVDVWEFLFNHSFTASRTTQRRIYEEYYLEAHHYLNEKLEGRLAAAWNFDFTTNTDNLTPIVDLLFNLTSRQQIHLNYQHQHTINKFDQSEYDTEFLLIEYSRSPWFTLALVGEYTNKYQLRNVQLDQHVWLYVNLNLNFWNNQHLSILYGSRQEGFVCVGGICRYEPEFKGIEIKLTNRL